MPQTCPLRRWPWLLAAACLALPGPGAAAPSVDWVTIPGGTFQMGSNKGEKDEKPRHQVKVKEFQLARTEVTFGQYNACVKAGACTPAHVSDGECTIYYGWHWSKGPLAVTFQQDDQPAVCVTWSQAGVFATWAGGRLPTEAEWEYAARGAGKERVYPWGDADPSCDLGSIFDSGLACGRTFPWPVCSRPKGNTEQGLCDMSGNAWEWTQDLYVNSYKGAPSDGSAWELPTGRFRVVRGGSWRRVVGSARAADRSASAPDYCDAYLGFRPARSR